MRHPNNHTSDQPHGTLQLHVKTDNRAVPMLVLATGQGPLASQERFHFDHTGDAEVTLAPGRYSIQVVAKQHQPAMEVVTIENGKTAALNVSLLKETWNGIPPFETRLKAYGVSAQHAAAEVTLKEGEHRVVQNKAGQPGLVQIRPKTLREVRQLRGAPFGVFNHDEPQFGEVRVSNDTIARLKAKKLTKDDRAALRSLAHEYLNGNDKAHASLIEELSPALSALITGDFWVIGVKNLTIPAGATYTFGPGTLTVDTLRISSTGKIVTVGECKLDIAHWITTP